MYNDFNKLSDEELIDICKSCHEAIYVVECYGVSDMRLLNASWKELMDRGYTIEEVTTINIYKEEYEDENEEKEIGE